jgi:tRNA 2-thiouridine synthesizing protein B
MILNTFNKNDIRSTSLLCCLATMSAGDALLLLEDGVYAALAHTGLLSAIPAGVTLYVLQEDLAARGISDKIYSDFIRVDYREFVALTLQCSKTVNWN